ncbi:MAG: tetratricopeptide repeat protein [Leptolyngbyaceae cyanobacterium MO_188.B28]|nr:tetratricopeptide repeat protein [Leptolyngbyaceae cyanobacterium MO_188.B28]
MEKASIERLLQSLRSSDETIRDQATEELWRIWFQQKGVYGAQLLMQSQTLLQAGNVQQAEELLTEITQHQPDFTEAWNRRAVLHYTQGNYWQAVSDCQKALDLTPYHFGALHGLGLCHAALGNYTAAIQSFRKSLEIQPHALINQRLILECTAKLS